MNAMMKSAYTGFNKKLLGSVLAIFLVMSFMSLALIVPEIKPAYAAVSVKKGTIPSTSTCTPLPCVVNYTGTGFQPKALLIFSTNDLHTDGYGSQYRMTMGFSDGTNDRSISTKSVDAKNPTIAKRILSDVHIIKRYDESTGTSNTIEAQAEVNKFHGDGFELTWSVDTRIHCCNWYMDYLAIGGDDIKNVTISTITSGTATGSKMYTGLGFKPDFIMFLYDRKSGNASSTNAGFGMGFAAANSLSSPGATCLKQASLMGISEDGQTTSDTARAQRTDRAIYVLQPNDASSSTPDAEALFEGFNSDGFTLNWIDLPTDTNDKFYYMAIKGGKWDVGKLDVPTATAPVTQSISGLGFTPKGLLLTSFNNASATGIIAHNRISIGASDGTNKASIWSGDKDNVSPSVSALYVDAVKVIRLVTEATTASSSTKNAEADLQTFDTSGFTLNWTTTDPAFAREVIYIAFG